MAAVAAALLVPVALTFACGPQAAIHADKTTYTAGESGTISGENFYAGASVSIDLEGGTTLASVVVPEGGSFTVGFVMPAVTGTKYIVANITTPQGNFFQSTPAAVTVSAPAPAPEPAPSPGGSPGSAGQPAPVAAAPPATGGGPAPAKTTKQPGKAKAKKSPAAKQKSQATSTAAAAAGAATAQIGGAFAGSVPARTARSSAATSKRSARSTRTPATTPSEKSAQAGAWGGLGTSGDAALVPAGGYAANAGSSNTARTLSIVLLSLGLAVLAGGAGMGEARRRRSRDD